MSTSTAASGALPKPAVAWRAAVTLLITAGAVWGTVFGTDDAWPFAPMKMYATSTDPTGVVAVLTLEARSGTGAWRPVELVPGSVGINRAEADGQLPRLVDDPALLGTLAQTHARLVPGDAPWTGLRIVSVGTVLEDGSPTGEIRREVRATWSAP